MKPKIIQGKTEETKRKVLVLEDSSFEAERIVKALSKLGYQPKLTTNIREAKIEICADSYYAAILDNQVPMSKGLPPSSFKGYYLAFELHEEYPELRIALHTSDNLRQKEITEMTSSSIVHLNKSSELEVLTNNFRAFLEN